MAAGLRAFELTGATIAIVDIPLLFETGGQARFDRVVATVCSPPAQLARLLGRGLSDAEARQRLAAQMPAEEKAARADLVIRTDGTFMETDAQVEAIWSQLTASL
jgi:dephospho-CoA kinase